MIRTTLPMIALVIAIGTPAPTTAQERLEATITVFGYQAGGPALNLGVAIPKSINAAARNRNVDYGLELTVTYVDLNGVVQTLDSGRLSIKSDTFDLGPIDRHTELIETPLNFGATPQPGDSPSFTGTAHILRP